jgi:hypothetical protein
MKKLLLLALALAACQPSSSGNLLIGEPVNLVSSSEVVEARTVHTNGKTWATWYQQKSGETYALTIQRYAPGLVAEFPEAIEVPQVYSQPAEVELGVAAAANGDLVVAYTSTQDNVLRMQRYNSQGQTVWTPATGIIVSNENLRGNSGAELVWLGGDKFAASWVEESETKVDTLYTALVDGSTITKKTLYQGAVGEFMTAPTLAISGSNWAVGFARFASLDAPGAGYLQWTDASGTPSGSLIATTPPGVLPFGTFPKLNTDDTGATVFYTNLANAQYTTYVDRFTKGGVRAWSDRVQLQSSQSRIASTTSFGDTILAIVTTQTRNQKPIASFLHRITPTYNPEQFNNAQTLPFVTTYAPLESRATDALALVPEDASLKFYQLSKDANKAPLLLRTWPGSADGTYLDPTTKTVSWIGSSSGNLWSAEVK